MGGKLRDLKQMIMRFYYALIWIQVTQVQLGVFKLEEIAYIYAYILKITGKMLLT